VLIDSSFHFTSTPIIRINMGRVATLASTGGATETETETEKPLTLRSRGKPETFGSETRATGMSPATRNHGILTDDTVDTNPTAATSTEDIKTVPIPSQNHEDIEEFSKNLPSVASQGPTASTVSSPSDPEGIYTEPLPSESRDGIYSRSKKTDTTKPTHYTPNDKFLRPDKSVYKPLHWRELTSTEKPGTKKGNTFKNDSSLVHYEDGTLVTEDDFRITQLESDRGKGGITSGGKERRIRDRDGSMMDFYTDEVRVPIAPVTIEDFGWLSRYGTETCDNPYARDDWKRERKAVREMGLRTRSDFDIKLNQRIDRYVDPDQQETYKDVWSYAKAKEMGFGNDWASQFLWMGKHGQKLLLSNAQKAALTERETEAWAKKGKDVSTYDLYSDFQKSAVDQWTDRCRTAISCNKKTQQGCESVQVSNFTMESLARMETEQMKGLDLATKPYKESTAATGWYMDGDEYKRDPLPALVLPNNTYGIRYSTFKDNFSLLDQQPERDKAEQEFSESKLDEWSKALSKFQIGPHPKAKALQAGAILPNYVVFDTDKERDSFLSRIDDTDRTTATKEAMKNPKPWYIPSRYGGDKLLDDRKLEKWWERHGEDGLSNATRTPTVTRTSQGAATVD